MVVIIATVPKQVATKKGIRVFSRDMVGWNGREFGPKITQLMEGKVRKSQVSM